jgi:hypothetical protein
MPVRKRIRAYVGISWWHVACSTGGDSTRYDMEGKL